MMKFNTYVLRIFTLISFLLLCVQTVSANGSLEQKLFNRITEEARKLSEEPYSEPGRDVLPAELDELNYSEYRDIRFNKNLALWDKSTLFSVEFFHLGFLYKYPVIIHEIVDNEIRTIQYDPTMFDYGKTENLRDKLSPGLGFAGFRIHYPINTDDYKDEVIAFLGATYFRMIGRGQQYGASARGIAVNTALPEGEEFPRFKEFWLVRPGTEDTTVRFYALMDSKSLTGAYRFELNPRSDTVLEVKTRLFARNDIEKLGVAPLTSMFMWGENKVRHYDDYRPEVHDSDGLLVHTSSGEWIWRPLTNPEELHVSALLDRNVRGFGLMQRDRNFENYQDMESRYENRPGMWVTPGGGDWDKGEVQLVEIPSGEESNDNIVAYWVPEKQLKAGESRTFEYKLFTVGADVNAEDVATVKATRIGWGATPGTEDKPPVSQRQFIVDFHGGELLGLDKTKSINAELTASGGKAKDITVQALPGDRGWRVAFKIVPGDESTPVDMRLFLLQHGNRVSETWNYIWDPDLVAGD